jgi:hypothetical protein
VKFFYPVHIPIGMTEQGIGILAVVGVTGHADTARGHFHRAKLRAKGFGHDGKDVLHLLGHGAF